MGATRVACGILVEDGLILLAQRGERMAHPLRWEFPGGKIHEGESPEACLARELREELGVGVRILRALPPAVSRLHGAELVLHPFVCEISEGRPTPHEHRALVWTAPAEAAALELLPADRPVLEGYLRRWAGRDPADRRATQAGGGALRKGGTMLSFALSSLAAAALLAALARPAAAGVGKEAPRFTADSTAGRISLEDYRGRKNVLLAFYFKDFTGG